MNTQPEAPESDEIDERESEPNGDAAERFDYTLGEYETEAERNR